MESTAERLPKSGRVAKRRDYLRTYEAGRKLFSRFVVLFYAPAGLEQSRIGITATRKLGKANVRNRFKRWTRETWRRERAPLGLDELRLDIVVNVKPSAAGASFTEYRDDLARLLARLAREARR